MRKSAFTISIAICFSLLSFRQDKAEPEVVFRTYGVKINVTDLEKAIDFYCTKLGFTIENKTESQVTLKTGDANKLVLNKVRHLAPTDQLDTGAGLTLQVNHLDSTLLRLKTKGLSITADLIRKEAVGNALYIEDPFGNRLSLMHQTITPVPHFTEPRIYNFGFLIPDMSKARAFYCDNFGFVVRSEKYLPLDLPLGHSDKTFAFMLHYREGVKQLRFNVSDNERIVILFQSNDLDRAMRLLSDKGVQFQQRLPLDSGLGRIISFYDPFGYLSELVDAK